MSSWSYDDFNLMIKSCEPKFSISSMKTVNSDKIRGVKSCSVHPISCRIISYAPKSGQSSYFQLHIINNVWFPDPIIKLLDSN
ncbi:hypothetical protein MXB_1194 [Myxobolus squamalis]|nr:hypothetical protein MXB_1194 [Myxobolus squamalis]